MTPIATIRTALASAATSFEASIKLAEALAPQVERAAAFDAQVTVKAAAVAAGLKAAGYIDQPRADKLAAELASNPSRIFDVITFVTSNPVDGLGKAAAEKLAAPAATGGKPEDAFDRWVRTGSPVKGG